MFGYWIVSKTIQEYELKTQEIVYPKMIICNDRM